MEYLNRKDIWYHIIKYIEIKDLLNLELTNRAIKSNIRSFYEKQTESFEKSDKKFDSKKEYLKKYINACLLCTINSEYDSDKTEKISSVSENSLSTSNNVLSEDPCYKINFNKSSNIESLDECKKKFFSEKYEYFI